MDVCHRALNVLYTTGSFVFWIYVCASLCVCVYLCVCLPHLSSSSSMKPLLSASSTVKTFFTSSEDLAFRPTISKNFLWSKESATAHTHTHTRRRTGMQTHISVSTSKLQNVNPHLIKCYYKDTQFLEHTKDSGHVRTLKHKQPVEACDETTLKVTLKVACPELSWVMRPNGKILIAIRQPAKCDSYRLKTCVCQRTHLFWVMELFPSTLSVYTRHMKTC